MSPRTNRRAAFTLVELSIVLVILGLLVGGVLAGQSLIRAAELRSVPRDIENYNMAIRIFKDKYMALPGDMNNATTYWGEADADPATCQATPSTGPETCNGNGNGAIANAGAINGDMYESFRAWQHLTNAGLIEGHFTGVAGPHAALAQTLIGTNVPASKIGGGGFTLFNWWSSVDYYWGANDAGLILIFGAQWPNYSTTGPVLLPSEQWAIEQKMDDGKPFLGNIYTIFNTACTTGNATTDEYALSTSTPACMIVWKVRR